MNYTLQDLYNYTITTDDQSMTDNLCNAYDTASAIDQYMDEECQGLLVNGIITKTEVLNIYLCRCLLQVPSIAFAAAFKCFIGFGVHVTIFDQFLDCIRGST